MKTMNYQNKIANNWGNIDWKKADSNLADLQYEVLKAYRKGDDNLVLTAQHTLIRSFAARCLAGRKVTSSQGGNTLGDCRKKF